MHEAKAKFTTGTPVRIPKALREEMEAAIQAHLLAVEKLTAVLDRADGDPDLEPSLGHHVYGRKEVDLEGGDVQDERHDDADEGNAEPSLAHSNDMNQLIAQRHVQDRHLKLPRGTGWVYSAGDLEAEHDGREPNANFEGGTV